MQIHDQADSVVGQPICALCYDYESHVIWQWWAPELWRRFTMALRRNLAHRIGVPASPQSLAKVATVQYAKVAEYQVRGAIHFHALIRLDGPKTDAGLAPAPNHFSASMLAELIAETVSQVRYEPPAAYATDPGKGPVIRGTDRRQGSACDPSARQPGRRIVRRTGSGLPG